MVESDEEDELPSQLERNLEEQDIVVSEPSLFYEQIHAFITFQSVSQ